MFTLSRKYYLLYFCITIFAGDEFIMIELSVYFSEIDLSCGQLYADSH